MEGNSSGGGGGGGYDYDITRITDKYWNNFCLEPPRPLTGESNYLTALWVSGNREPPEVSPFAADSSSQSSFQPKTENVVPLHRRTRDKIKAALKFLTFREQRVLVQFWSPRDIGKHQLLTTRDQPFGFGVLDEGLFVYRKYSEINPFFLDKNHEEDDRSPLARVLRKGLVEWTSDITNYLSTDFPQQEYAIRCNLHGYLVLPVFSSTTGLCVGVLELLMSSIYQSYANEVQQVHIAMKTADLTTPLAFGCPTSRVQNEHRHNVMEKILSILKVVCGTHKLPLAQTWAMSPSSSFASHKQLLMKSCNSFDTRCLGNVCMSTTPLPFHVLDLRVWPFLEACRERHLDKSQGCVGRALSSRGLCFCGDVSKLSEEEYPLVNKARRSGLTSCFAFFLHSVECNGDYVLEFFLPHMEDGGCIPNVMQTLKQNIEVAGGFELGDTSSTQVVGPSIEVNSLSLYIDPHTIQMFSTSTTETKMFETVSSDSELMVASVAKAKSTYDPSPWSSAFTPKNFDVLSLAPEYWQGNGDDDIRDYINVVGAKKNDNTTFYPSVNMQKVSDAVTTAAEKSNCSKRRRKRKTDFLTMEAVEQHVGKPIDEAGKSLGVSRSTLKRFCREHGMPSWPFPKYNKKPAQVTNLKLLRKSEPKQNLPRSSDVCRSIYAVVFLLVRVKRWSCSSKRHGFSGRWWSCGKHCYSPLKSDFIYQAARLLGQLRRWRIRSSIRHAIQNRDHPAVCESTPNPKYTTNIINPYLQVDGRLAAYNVVHATPKQTMVDLSNRRMVTVKATFKGDMIKFQFQTSLGLSELVNNVAQRIKLDSRMVRLNYLDEDNDLILLACDTDLHTLLGLSTSNSTIKLFILTADD